MTCSIHITTARITQGADFCKLLRGFDSDDLTRFVDHLERHHNDRATQTTGTSMAMMTTVATSVTWSTAVGIKPIANRKLHFVIAIDNSRGAICKLKGNRENQFIATCSAGAGPIINILSRL